MKAITRVSEELVFNFEFKSYII